MTWPVSSMSPCLPFEAGNRKKAPLPMRWLVRVCRLYQVSSDYLLGLSNIDPVYEQRRRLEQFSPEELTDLKKYESYLLWKKRSEKNKT